MKQISGGEFDKIIKSEKPVLVDFFATWCGPCKMLSPVLEQVSEGANGEFDVVKIDVDEAFDIAKRYGIMSVPTMIVFKNGEEQDKIIGLRQKYQIEEIIKNYV